MNYICTNCGHIFEEGEEVIKHYDGEDWACCPSCGSTEIVDGVRCKECGKVVEENTLFDGWCKDCLLDKLADYDLFFQYLTDGCNGMDKVTGLEEFIFTMVWKLPEKYVPNVSSFDLKEALKKAYSSLVSYDRLLQERKLYELIKDWMTDLDLYDFAEWLNERERKKVKA